VRSANGEVSLSLEVNVTREPTAAHDQLFVLDAPDAATNGTDMDLVHLMKSLPAGRRG
jgi:hypothetical protein